MARRAYDSRLYRRNRKILMADDPICAAEGCDNPATQVDHIRPVKEWGSNDLTNLRPVCATHNRGKGGRFPTSEETNDDTAPLAARYSPTQAAHARAEARERAMRAEPPTP